ncbi:MAG: DUF3488 and transglutaminase-like domain-containing protein [Actinomycetota bacterium]
MDRPADAGGCALSTTSPGQPNGTPQPVSSRFTYTGARRTLVGLLACCLAIAPLRQLFTDWAWLLDAWLMMAITVVPAAALRTRWQPRAAHLLPGLMLAVMVLTARYVPDHAVGGVLPLHGAWIDIGELAREVGDTIRDGAAPLPSTGPVRMMLSAQLALLAVAVDLLAVVARRPALAGIPFLLIFTLSGAIPREPVGWLWFALSAVGYLLLLASDTRDELARWGRIMPRASGSRSSAVQALSGRRIGVIAIVLAVCVPLVIPMRTGNIVADVLHRTSGGDGLGNGRGIGIDAFASLRGKLNRPKPANLFTVQARPSQGHQPFYLRQDVLDRFTGKGWAHTDNGTTEALTDSVYSQLPSIFRSQLPSADYEARITIDQLGGNAVVLQSANRVEGLSDKYRWSPRNQLVVGNGVGEGDSYTEQVSEPQPSVTQLQVAERESNTDEFARWLDLPDVPAQVRAQVNTITADTFGPYAKARAISDFFANPNNNFVYSLQTKEGDSGSDLVDFLTNRVGFCQQYAAAMGVMLRIAGVPARVVLGYTHPPLDGDGKFVVTTNDAHAWVEAYFGTVGWVPFDPTPLTGADAGRAVTLGWAPHPNANSTATPTDPNARNSDQPSGQPQASSGAVGRGSGRSSSGGLLGWPFWSAIVVLLVLIVVGLLPALIRWLRHRRRLRAAVDPAHGPDPLWAELADTAVDLGYVWSPVRTPRQVVSWLARDGVSGPADESLRSLAGAVETARYAGPGVATEVATEDLVDDLRQVSDSLRSRRTRGERIKARLMPASLGWFNGRWPFGGGRAH